MDRTMDPTISEHHWHDLQHVASQRRDNRRTLVPVLGAGVRNWLGMPPHFGSWRKLLRRVAKQVEVDSNHLMDPRPSHQVYEPWLIGEYEALVHAYRDRRMPSKSTSEAENALVQQVVHPLLNASQRQRGDVSLRLDQLLGLDFADWIDLSIDNVFTGRLPDDMVVSGRIGNRPRTVRVPLPNGARSWHPHGFIHGEHAATTTVLGVQRYARTVSGVVKAFDQVKAFHASTSGVDTFADLRTLEGAPLDHWVHLALNAPLLLLGVGASSEEWDLWAFLELRARAHARLPVETRPPVFRLTCDEPSEQRPRVQLATAGRVLPVRHVHGGASWEEAWEHLLRRMR